MFNFTPLLGAQSESPASQSLLELDGGVEVLVDVGWDEGFDAQRLEAIQKHVSTLSLVLLTHPTIEHLGGYAHCCKHIPLFAKLPVYATTPVINLGRTLLTDLYASSPLAASLIPASAIVPSATSSPSDASPNFLLDAPTPEEIATYFAAINALKYSQPHQPVASPFSPPVSGLTITAYGAGHTLGGTIWHIQQGTESIVYAADWNQGRENLLPGATLLGGNGQEIIEPLQRPTALICSAKGVEKEQSVRKENRDAMLVGLVRETIAQGGKVLIPTDSSARMLELAFLLNEAWREGHGGPHADTYKNARLYMASKSAKASVRYLQSMLEWVEEGVRAEAEAAMTQTKGKGHARNPMEWRHVKMLERRSQVEQVLGRSKPCVMLASDVSLEWGFSRQAVQALASDPRNLVILTEKVATVDPLRKGFGKQLWEAWHDRQGQPSAASGVKVINGDGMLVEYQQPSATSLSADEAALYETYMVRQRQLHSSMQGDNTLADTSTERIEQQDEEDSDSDEEEDEDTEHQGRALNLSAQLTQSHKRKQAAGAAALTDAELGVNVLLRSGKNTVHDYDVRSKRGREKVFPFVAPRHKGDEFGEFIRPDEYRRAEERDEVGGMDMRNGGGKNDNAASGQKRKRDDFSATQSGRRGEKQQRGNKKARIGDARRGGGGPDDIDAAIARATGEGNGPTTAAAAAEDNSTDEESESDYEPEAALPLGPQKVVYTPHTLQLHLRVSYLDFAGLHDLRALLMIIPMMRPRKLILTSGEERETRVLAEKCRELLQQGQDAAGTDVFTPRVGEVVDASVDTNAWTLKLSRRLVKRLTWQNVKGLGVVALTGRLGLETTIDEKSDVKVEMEESARKRLKLLKADEKGNTETSLAQSPAPEPKPNPEARLPVLDLPTPSSSSTTLGTRTLSKVTQPVHVGDMRLADLRHLLNSTGHRTAFVGEGTLLVDQTVLVRKVVGGRIEIECAVQGVGRGSFYAVKRAVYAGLAVVAGV